MSARISLTMIVKNESATLSRCLASMRGLVEAKGDSVNAVALRRKFQ